MFESVRNAWKIADLRKKILYTIFIIVLFRFGSIIPVPFINAEYLKNMFHPQAGAQGVADVFNFLNIMAGGALERASIFAMSIAPYITASIIIQLLTVAIPALEKMQKEGDEGRKKIQQIVRYSTIVLGLLQGYAYYTILRYGTEINGTRQSAITTNNWFTMAVIVLSFTAGTALIMWLGEQINERGIGNGISIILFASIISRGPQMVYSIYYGLFQAGRFWMIPLALIVAVALVVFIIIMNDAERRVPVQYAKRVVGRKMYGGQSTHLPLKVSMTGVLPIIFASSFVTIPSLISGFFPTSGFANFITKYFGFTTIAYAAVYFLLVIFFNYFYVAVQYNPVEIANNIKKNGGFVPGIRPGKPTSDFISKVVAKITFIGAMFLGLVAVLPIFLSMIMKINLHLGGTTILIVVGVILETLKQLESQMLMRHYKGFLE